MPTLEETLSNISNEVSQIGADISDIDAATSTKAGLVAISDNTTPLDNSVPTVAFFKNRNILGAGGEAAGGLPQAQLDQIAALPSEAALAALSTLPVAQINALPSETILAALAALPAAQISALPTTAILTALGALPVSLTGQAGKVIAVNATGDGYEIVTAPTGGGGGTLPTSIVVNRFTGDGSTVAFTLSQSPADSNALDITVSGISIDPAIYNVSGTTLTFNDAPPITDANAIVVRHLGTVAAVGDASIITIKLADKAVTLGKMADGTAGKFLKYNDSTGVIEEGDPIVGTVADNSINTLKLINKNVTLQKLADGTPGKSLKYNDSTGVIEETDIIVPDNSIVTSKLFSKTVTLGKIADGTPGKFLKFNDSTGVIEEADGAAGAVGTWNFIEEQIISSNTTEVAFTTAINSTYKIYRMRAHGMERAGGSGSNIQFRVTKNGGVSYETGNEYAYIRQESFANGPNTTPTGTTSTNLIDIGHHEDTATGIIEIEFYEPSSITLEKPFRFSLISPRNPNTIWNEGVGFYGKSDFAAINGFKLFFANADSFSAGRFILEGKN
ncbi:MAG: hypothetical protein O2942_09205 [Proteobacteria bacterium]|nr:hypothetical protein [Pseudomonadota bacterium]